MKAIITFHSIDTSGSVLSYPPDSFASLLDALGKSGLPVLELGKLLAPETDRGVSFTFDDGMRSVFTSALPILRDHDVPAHLCLTSAAVGKDNQWPGQPGRAPVFDMLNWDQIEALHGAGVYIESHTHNHPDLRTLNHDELEQECERADRIIEQRVGRRPQFFAYPYGYKNDAICDFMRSRYKGAVTTELGMIHGNEDFAKLPRLDSYYLKNRWLQRNLDSPVSSLYLLLRSHLRELRGTQ